MSTQQNQQTHGQDAKSKEDLKIKENMAGLTKSLEGFLVLINSVNLTIETMENRINENIDKAISRIDKLEKEIFGNIQKQDAKQEKQAIVPRIDSLSTKIATIEEYLKKIPKYN